MQLLQVMAGANFGGAETYFVDMVTALHHAGLDQKVVEQYLQFYQGLNEI